MSRLISLLADEKPAIIDPFNLRDPVPPADIRAAGVAEPSVVVDPKGVRSEHLAAGN